MYLPEDLYERLKRRGGSVNVSGVLQAALAERLAELDRQDALAEAVAGYEGEFGTLDPDDVRRQEEADRAAASKPRQAPRRTRVA